MARNYDNASDDDFDLIQRPIQRPNYALLDREFMSDDDDMAFMRRDSSGGYIIEPGQSASRSSTRVVSSQTVDERQHSITNIEVSSRNLLS